MSSLLVRCYPATWRDRYGAEFEALLEDIPVGPLDVADILLGALDAHLRTHGHQTNITRGKGFDMSLRIGGLTAILGAILWAVAGVVNSGVLGAADKAAPAVLLAASLPLWLVAMACMSAFQARTNPAVAWAAFGVPAVGIVACLAGMIGIATNSGEVFWAMFGLGSLTAVVGSVIFAVVTYQAATLSRISTVVLATGLVVTFVTLGTSVVREAAALGLATIALGWFALGVQAIRLAPPAAARRST
jgi:hypothetical protein